MTPPPPRSTLFPYTTLFRSHFSGTFGTLLVAAGAVISSYGYLSANMLHTPRLTFAMGEQGDFPQFFGWIHSKFRTPYVSIVAFALALVLFSVGGNFRWNAVLSAVSRLFIYSSVAAALPALRRRHRSSAHFRLPAGMLFVTLALIFTGTLATQMHGSDLAAIGVTFVIAALNWLWARRRVLAPAGTI